MSEFKHRENRGSLFPNDLGRSDYSGTANIGGVEYFINGFINTSETTGRTWTGLSFTKKSDVPDRNLPQ